MPSASYCLQLTSGIHRQSQSTPNWICLWKLAAHLCCYRTKAVIDHRGGRAQLLALVPRQARAIDLQNLRKLSLGKASTSQLDQLALPRWEHVRIHEYVL